MNIKKLFYRKRQQQLRQEPQPLRIEGIGPAPLTPEPDEAELAAQALLEMMSSVSDKVSKNHLQSSHDDGKGDAPRDVAYYQSIADRIRTAKEQARQRTIRFIAFVEQELKNPHLPLTGPGSLGLLEAELYKRIDVVERYGGEMKRRWLHCLAQVTTRIWKQH